VEQFFMLRSNRGECQACASCEKVREPDRSSVRTNRIVASLMVLAYQCFWDSGTVAARRGVPVRCTKREGVYPGAIRINGERARPLARNAYLT
jgi:hypothetical protein